MTRLNRWTALLALGASIGMGPLAAAGQDLPPEIQVDLYLVRADRYIQSQDWNAALEALDVVFALQAANDMETPVELWFKHAQAALEAGHVQTAVTSATRYLVEAGQAGDDYTAALALLDEAQRRAAPAPAPTPTRTPTPTPRTTAPPPADVAEAGGIMDGLTVLFPLVGMNAATMTFTSSGPLVPDASYLNGISGGAAVAFPVMGEMLGVQIGAHYSQKGTRIAQGNADVTANADVSFQYVDISLLARISPPQIANVPRLPLYALIGPYASLELDCRVAVDATAGMGRFTASDDCANASLDTQPVDFGLSGGVGVEMGSGTTRVNVGVLYSYGLQDIDKVIGETARHRALNLFAGVATTF